MEVIRPNSLVLQRLRTASKSGLFVRISKRSDMIYFSQLVVDVFELKKFDHLEIVKDGNEVWARKINKDGFAVVADGRLKVRVCDTALTKWLLKATNHKAPCRIKVVITKGNIYFLSKNKSKAYSTKKNKLNG